ncbi:MAG: hypothetical protein ACK56I_28740, partial [bacterium]
MAPQLSQHTRWASQLLPFTTRTAPAGSPLRITEPDQQQSSASEKCFMTHGKNWLPAPRFWALT